MEGIVERICRKFGKGTREDENHNAGCIVLAQVRAMTALETAPKPQSQSSAPRWLQDLKLRMRKLRSSTVDWQGKSGLMFLPDELLAKIAYHLDPESVWKTQRTCRRLYRTAFKTIKQYDVDDIRSYKQSVGYTRYEETLKTERLRVPGERWCCARCLDTHPAECFSERALRFGSGQKRCCYGSTQKFYIFPGYALDYKDMMCMEQLARDLQQHYPDRGLASHDPWTCPHDNGTKNAFQCAEGTCISRYLGHRLYHVQTFCPSTRVHYQYLCATARHVLYACRITGTPPTSIVWSLQLSLRSIAIPLCPHTNTSDAYVLHKVHDGVEQNFLTGQRVLTRAFKCLHPDCMMDFQFRMYVNFFRNQCIVVLESRRFLPFRNVGGDFIDITDPIWIASTERRDGFRQQWDDRKCLRHILENFVWIPREDIFGSSPYRRGTHVYRGLPDANSP